MNNFRTLNLAIELYRQCQKLKAPAYLKDQLNRASSSVALNLGEGRGKRTIKDQGRFYYNAFGSLKETQVILKLIPNAPDHITQLADKTAAHLYCLLKSMNLEP